MTELSHAELERMADRYAAQACSMRRLALQLLCAGLLGLALLLVLAASCTLDTHPVVRRQDPGVTLVFDRPPSTPIKTQDMEDGGDE